jgi:thiol-disulfide isomerase/thioredoxin
LVSIKSSVGDERTRAAVGGLPRWGVKRWHVRPSAPYSENLHLISLVSKPAPALITKEYLRCPASLKGRKTLFFWAHWCGDCKAQAPILARIRKEIPESKLAIVAPTQPYGYVEGGNEAPLADEIGYIKGVFEKYYSRIEGVTVPVSEENFKAWGSSTTPTLVLIDEGGVVRGTTGRRRTTHRRRRYATNTGQEACPTAS